MSNLSKKSKKTMRIIKKMNKKLDRASGVACNSTNHSSNDKNIQDNINYSSKSNNENNSDKPIKKPIRRKQSISRKKQRVYKYCKDDFPRGREKSDETKAESHKVHKKICRVHRDIVARSFDKRIFKKGQKSAFNACLGIRGQYAEEMLTSDIKLKFQLGNAFINEMYDLWQLSQLDHRLKVYHITPLSDKFQMNVRNGKADVKGVIDKIQAAVRQYTSFDAIGVVENQVIVGQAKDRDKETFYPHIHMICWGYAEDDHRNLIDCAKGYQAQLTKVPILAQRVGETEGDFTRLGRYLCKPPYEGKKINIEDFNAGRKCVKSTLCGVKKYHQFRLFEYGAKLPIEHSIFGVRGGIVKKDRILKSVRDWHQARKGTKLELGGQVDSLFKDVLKQNEGRLGNYEPMQVIHKRPKL